jgi:predicted unusual protein kinase regulating ubiquinone biosynthesis (AarF/ABC1/UbiB family)
VGDPKHDPRSKRDKQPPGEVAVPQSRLGRLARMAAAGARTGASMLAARGLGSSSEKTAQRTAEVLGTMRGLAAKMGQMASYVDGLLPEEHRDTYEAAMKHLRSAAPRSSPAEVRKVIEEELGAPVRELFASFDDEAFASASIGQVHHATLHDGRAVAVKVQHPGIQKAIEADLTNAGLLESMAAMGGARRFNSKSVLDVIKKRFREELDYRREAENLRLFARIHAGEPLIRFPALVEDRSAHRVLTTELVTGRTFEDACTATEAEREAWARTLWRFVFKGNLVGGHFNADPHPGNYFFHDDGAVTFLDFGCVQPIGEEHRRAAGEMHRVAIARDEAAFRVATRRMLATKPGRYEDALYGFIRECFEPLFHERFRFTRDFASGLVAHAGRMGKTVRALDDDELVPISEHFVFLNRLQFGFYSVLARMDVEVSYADVERSFWHEMG